MGVTHGTLRAGGPPRAFHFNGDEMRRLIFPLLLGLAGCALLLALGIWQVQRLHWKESVLARIEAQIAAAPIEVPAAPTEAADEYRPVTVTGALGGREVRVFAPVEGLGVGYRVLSVLAAGDRLLLVDLGFVPQSGDDGAPAGRMAERVTITGNLLWPDEVTGSTPPPDSSGLWYARDVPGIAAELGTEPFLIVARTIDGADLGTVPVPVTTTGIPNNHREYAITWFLLAVVWAAMTGYLIWRVIRRKD